MLYKIISFLIMLSLSCVGTASESEDKLLLAYIYNLGKFVNFPEKALGPDSPIMICFYGESSNLSNNINTLESKLIKNHPIKTNVIARGGSISDCQIIYISESEAIYFGPIIGKLKNKPVLIMSKADDFIDAGGMINFNFSENKLRFDINKQAIDKAQLSVSSQVLRLARKVIE